MTMTMDKEFTTVAESEVDTRGRLSLGRAGAKPGRRYRIDTNPDGVLVLTPVVSIPEREMEVWRDPKLAERIRTGIDQSEAGHTGRDRGSFQHHLDDNDEE